MAEQIHGLCSLIVMGEVASDLLVRLGQLRPGAGGLRESRAVPLRLFG